jgi:hypothetical protein
VGKHKQRALKSDQRGISHIFVGVVGLLVLFMIILVGVSVSQQGNRPKSAKSIAAGKASGCVKTFKDNDYCKFATGYDLEKQSYKITAANTDTHGTTTITYLSDGRGNSSEASITSGAETDIVFYNGVPYLKDSDGTWIQFKRGDSSAPKYGNPVNDVKFDTAVGREGTSRTYKKAGSEKCGGLPCLKYQLVDSSQPALTEYFWFDTKDYRLQRYTSKDTSSTFDVTLSYIPVRIKAPSPTKDFTPGDSSSSDNTNP